MRIEIGRYGVRRGTVAAAMAVGVAGLAGCAGGGGSPLAPPEDAAFAISDGAHSGGNEHFFFLPPLVSNPSSNGTFDAGLSPVIRISDGAGFDITLDADLDNSSSHYHQNWRTGDYDLDPTHTYRISVLVDGVELGFADVDVVESGSQLKNVDTNEYIALKDGRTLPILFRIEEGALATEPAHIELTTTVTGSSVPSGQIIEFNVCAPDGSGVIDCPDTGPNTDSNSVVTVDVAPGTWWYELKGPQDLFGPCQVTGQSPSPDALTLASGQTASLFITIECSGF